MTAQRKPERSLLKPEFILGLILGLLLGASLMVEPALTRDSLMVVALLILSIACLRVLFARERKRLGRYEPVYPGFVRILAFFGLCAIFAAALYAGSQFTTHYLSSSVMDEVVPARPHEFLVLAVARNTRDASALEEFTRVFKQSAPRNSRPRGNFRTALVRQSWLWIPARMDLDALADQSRASVFVIADGAERYRVEFRRKGAALRALNLEDTLGRDATFVFAADTAPSNAPACLARALAEYLVNDPTAALELSLATLDHAASDSLDSALRARLHAVAGLAAHVMGDCPAAMIHLRQAQREGFESKTLLLAINECDSVRHGIPDDEATASVVTDEVSPQPDEMAITAATSVMDATLSGIEISPGEIEAATEP